MRCRQVVVHLSLASENAAWIIGDIFQVDGVGWGADHELSLLGLRRSFKRDFHAFILPANTAAIMVPLHLKITVEQSE
jgi:hypothetical protein